MEVMSFFIFFFFLSFLLYLGYSRKNAPIVILSGFLMILIGAAFWTEGITTTISGVTPVTVVSKGYHSVGLGTIFALTGIYLALDAALAFIKGDYED